MLFTAKRSKNDVLNLGPSRRVFNRFVLFVEFCFSVVILRCLLHEHSREVRRFPYTVYHKILFDRYTHLWVLCSDCFWWCVYFACVRGWCIFTCNVLYRVCELTRVFALLFPFSCLWRKNWEMLIHWVFFPPGYFRIGCIVNDVFAAKRGGRVTAMPSLHCHGKGGFSNT